MSSIAMKNDRALSDTAVINAIAVLRSAGFFSIVPPAEPKPIHPLQRPAAPTASNLRHGILCNRVNEGKILDLRNNYRAALTARDLAFLDRCERAGAGLSVKDRCKLDALWRGIKFANIEEAV